MIREKINRLSPAQAVAFIITATIIVSVLILVIPGAIGYPVVFFGC